MLTGVEAGGAYPSDCHMEDGQFPYGEDVRRQAGMAGRKLYYETWEMRSVYEK